MLDEVLANKDRGDRIAYFYCSFSYDESLDATNILGSILAQLCSPNDAVYGKVGKLYDENTTQGFTKPQRLEPERLVDLILEQANDDHQTLIFLDAVNECGDPYKILSYIEALVMAPGARIQVCLSSINERGIEDHLLKIPNLATITLDQQEMKSDIDILLRTSLENHPRLRRHSHQLKEEIILGLTKGAQGMYVSPEYFFF